MLLVLFICIAIGVYAQNTIKFLGIPIDGTKKEMINQLKAKGYEYNSYADYLSGEFNGKNVEISVQTVNNRVWRIAVLDSTFSNEADIKIAYNNLFEQFSNNGKYVLLDGARLNDDDDISYEMSIKNKRYDTILCSQIYPLKELFGILLVRYMVNIR